MYQIIMPNADICGSILIKYMNCLLVAATAKEIAPFLEHYRNTEKFLFTDVLITGVGLTSTAYHLTKQLQLKRPGLVIQAGIGGCFDKKIPLGSVVAIRQDRIADQGVAGSKTFKTLFDLQLASPNQFPFKKGWLVNENNTLLKRSKLKAVKGISVNQVTVSDQMARFYKNEFGAVAESMEGAALHYVCLMEKIPFLQIRSLSNYTRERDKKKWYMKEAIASLNKELIRILQSL